MAFFGLIGGRRKSRRAERVEPRLSGGQSGGRSGGKSRAKSTTSARTRKRGTSRDQPRRPARRRRLSILRVVTWGATLCIWAGIVGIGATAYVYYNLDERGLFQLPEREPGMMLLSADGHVVAERGSFFGDEVRIGELPRYVPEAIIAIEDRRFEHHFGIDPVGLVRAFIANQQAGRVVQGGSTITQQLAKNLFLEPDRTYERKFQEAVLALWLENRYSKDEILQLYLNRTYFGAGATGVEKASQKFFGKSARDITIAEAAILAAVLNAPSALNPINHPERAAARARLVIAEMVESGFITRAEAEQGGKRPYRHQTDRLHPGHAIHRRLGRRATAGPDRRVRGERRGGNHHRPRPCRADAERAVRTRLDEQGEALGVSQAAVVVLDTDGGVKALVGGQVLHQEPVQQRREGQAPAGVVVQAVRLSHGARAWRNARQPCRRRARDHRGLVARELCARVSWRRDAAQGDGPVAQYGRRQARRLGGPEQCREHRPAPRHRVGACNTNASIALGTSEGQLLELTGAFSPFANGGRSVLPHVVTRMTTRDGRVLYERRGSGLGQVVMPWDVGAMNDMLRTVVTSGTGRRAAIAGRDIAGKTGTSQDYRDAWFIGYSAQLVAGVWTGNDDNAPTKRVTGGNLPAIIWKDVMEPAHLGLEALALPGDLGPQIASETPYDVQDMFSYRDAGTQPYDDTGIFGMFRGLFGGGRPAAAQPPQYGNGAEYRDPYGAAPAPEGAPARDRNYDHLNSR
jgi:penicillin-binding protein 1A